MATPFLFYGQDSGSLLYYYSGVLTSLRENYYVISYASNGDPYLVLYSNSQPLSTDFSRETNYQVNFDGDFFGLSESSSYNANLKYGEVFAGYRDEPYLKNQISGLVSGIQLDSSNLNFQISASVSGVQLDSNDYSFRLNDGVCSGILLDNSSYQLNLTSQISGVPIDNSSYSLSFRGEMSKSYLENARFNFRISGGSIGRGSVEFIRSGDDQFSFSFTINGGSMYKQQTNA
jgi:hypothetical protein